ncbi:RimK family alpha-L-glutamate ligase [Streptomyces sp. NPDC002917]|uniref:ATP-grasp domain-containing protein n=1 Tax=Streptomyces sp. NPDC002917 TaxID=3364671 RepID=UPI0036C6B982
MSLRIGVVNRFGSTPPEAYALGRALEAAGATFIPLPLSSFHVVPQSRRPPSVRILADNGRTTTTRDVQALGLAGVLWRVSENCWPACQNLVTALGASCRVINSPTCIRTCADKWLTHLSLSAAGVPSVSTWLVPPGALAPDTGTVMTVVKPAVGAGGRGIRAVRPGEVLNEQEALVAQPLLTAPPEEHVRVVVCRTEPVAAMRRRPPPGNRVNPVKVNNIEAEGTPIPTDIGPVGDLAAAAAAAVGGDVVAVDLVPGLDGRWCVLEVNSSPGLNGMEAAAVGCHAAVARRVVSLLGSVQ